MSEIKFDGRVAIVTGAGAGLGKAYALGLAKRGAKVVVNDLGVAADGSGDSQSSVADHVVAEIKAAGGKAAANYDAVGSPESGKSIVKTAMDNFGKADILINNAGILRDRSIIKMTEEEWEVVVSVHMKGAFYLTQAAFAIMKENKFGRIVNTTSGAALYGNFGQTNYTMAKTALLGLMHSVNTEGAKHNIKCNTIAPVAASRLTAMLPPELQEKLKPEFVMPIVLYLASEENQDANMIFNAGAGWFSRTAIMCGAGTIIGDAERDVSVEEVRDAWDKIVSLDDIKILNNVADTFDYMASLM